MQGVGSLGSLGFGLRLSLSQAEGKDPHNSVSANEAPKTATLNKS